MLSNCATAKSLALTSLPIFTHTLLETYVPIHNPLRPLYGLNIQNTHDRLL